MNFCPCLRWVVQKFGTNKERKYDSVEQYEQEQFMHSNKEEQSPSLDDKIENKNEKNNKGKIPSFEEQGQNNQESDLLNFKMELQDKPAPVKVASPLITVQTKQPQVDIQDLIKQQLAQTPMQAIKNIQQQSKIQPQTNIIQTYQTQQIDPKSFVLNLDPLDPYFALLHQKSSNLAQYFNKKGNKLQVGQPNLTNLQVSSWTQQRKNVFVMTYNLACSYSFYQAIIKSDRILIALSQTLAQAKTTQSLKSNLTRNTLKFKKISSLQRRDLAYIKYRNSLNRQHWQIYLNDDRADSDSNCKRCQVFCVKNMREKGEKELLVTEYVEIDFQAGSGIGNVLSKVVGEYRGFLNGIVGYIERNYVEELA